MKIREPNTSEGKINRGNKGKASDRVNRTDAKRFGDHMDANLRNLAMGELKQLLDDVDEYGGMLEAKFTLDCLFRYKDAVSKFLTKTVSNMFEFKKHDYYHDGSGRDVFAVVKKVNSKLEEITGEFLSEQNDRLSILTIIGEIRGMLLDLAM